MLSKALVGCEIVGVLMLVGAAAADPIPVTGFKDLWGSPAVVKTVKSQAYDRLMIDNGGSVASVGLDGTDWHIGFVDYRDGQTHVVGYAQNLKRVLPGYEGWMWGLYAYDMNFDEDLTPDDVFIVQDVSGDGIGVLDDGNWMLGGDDVFYDANDVLFGPGQVRGDVSQLPAYGISRYFPQMIISSVLSPITGDVNGDGFVGIDDLDIVLSNWNETVTPGDVLMGDPSGDGYVGIDDLDTVLGNWNAGTPPAAGAVPEPATVGWFTLSAVGMLGVRRTK